VWGGVGGGGGGWVVVAVEAGAAIIGACWMLFGLTVYVLYRRRQGLPLTETVKVVLAEPLGVAEGEYQSILVAFDDDEPVSEETMATAVELPSNRRRGIHVAAVRSAPNQLPLAAP